VGEGQAGGDDDEGDEREDREVGGHRYLPAVRTVVMV
jgi:hypothetical protein